MAKISLSDSVIRAIPPPGTGAPPDWHTDALERNLALKVSPAGVRSFWFAGRVHGRPQRIKVGHFPDISTDEARARVVRVRAAVYDGLDPRAALAYARPQRGAGTTLGDLWAMYGERYGHTHRRRWDRDCEDFDRYCGALAGQRIEALTPELLQAWHSDLGATRGHPTANKMLNALRAVFNRAYGWRGPDGRPLMAVNPAASRAIPRFDESDRDRYMDAEEIRALFQAIADYDSPDARHFFQLALFTGARKTNLMQMSFADIDGTNWIWNIPRAAFKGQKRGHSVPIIDQAQHILTTRLDIIAKDWVFPGRRRNGRPIANVKYWWAELTTAAGIQDVTIHDIRRTTASWMAITGASEAIISQFLGHQRQGVTAIYARLNTDAVRSAAQRAVDQMFASAGISTGRSDDRREVPHGTIVPLTRKA